MSNLGCPTGPVLSPTPILGPDPAASEPKPKSFGKVTKAPSFPFQATLVPCLQPCHVALFNTEDTLLLLYQRQPNHQYKTLSAAAAEQQGVTMLLSISLSMHSQEVCDGVVFCSCSWVLDL